MNAKAYAPRNIWGHVARVRLLAAFQVLAGHMSPAKLSVNKKAAMDIINQMTSLLIPTDMTVPPESSGYSLEEWLDWLAEWAVDTGQMRWDEPFGWAVPAAAQRGWFEEK